KPSPTLRQIDRHTLIEIALLEASIWQKTSFARCMVVDYFFTVRPSRVYGVLLLKFLAGLG
ncbi:MAG TPA: hypothetical protein VGK64_21540, partial [Bryobacteraceae bacterium]